MNQINAILMKNLSQRGEKLTDTQFITVCEAMSEYAIRAVGIYIDKEAKAARIEGVKFFTSIINGEFRLWIRKIYFLRAKRQAIIRSETEGLKIYIIRAGEYSYQVLSTRDVELNKKLRILGKNVDAKKLTEIADLVIYPKR